MGRRPARRRLALPIAAGALAIALLSLPAWGPGLGRRLAWFQVDRVEVAGATLVAPHEVLRVSGIRSGDSLFDDRAPWEAALEAHPVIASATITRRFPATLRVRIVEERPVALLAGDTLAPATAAGAILPLDPTAVPIDLPIVHGSPDDEGEGAAVRRTLAEAGRLGDLDPVLMRDVSEIRPLPGADAVVLLHVLGEVVVPAGAGPDRLARLRAVLADLTARAAPADRDLHAAGDYRIDLRFDDQVVVRHPSQRDIS